MLSLVKLEGFKAVYQAEVRLSPLTLLIGRNGSGKSSLIESLQWLQESLFAGLEGATTDRFGRIDDLINRRTTHLGINLEWDAAKRSHVRYGLWVKPRASAPSAVRPPIVEHEECILGRTTGARWVVRSRKGKAGPAVRSIHSGHPLRDGDELALARLDMRRQPQAIKAFVSFLRTAVFLRLSPAALGEHAALVARARGPALDEEGARLVALLNSMNAQQRARVQKRVTEVLETVTDVRVVRRGENGFLALREKMRARGGKRAFDIPSWLLSEGTRRLTAIFALLEARPRPGFLAIEEIENGLDPWTLTHVFEALRDAVSEGMQIVLTTHSPYLLDHVAPEEVVHVRRIHGDTTYAPLLSYDEVLKYKGVVAPGAMYVSDYLKDAHQRSSS